MDDVRLKVIIDESGQSLQNAQSTEVKHGYARIKAEYVISKPLGVKNLSQSAAIAELCLTENEEKSDKATQNKKTYGQPKRTRGMDKTREKKMANARKEVNQNVVRLCKSASMPGAKCKFGDKCTALHSKEEYWSRRPEDIDEQCVIFDIMGECNYGVSCRFANAHTSEDLSQTKKEPNGQHQPLINNHFQNVQMEMRKHAYNFSKADQIVQEFAPPIDKVKMPENIDLQPIIRRKPKLDMRTLKGKRYLAPLTTVGNLPFRRLCVDFGAEITCSEMAICTSLLQGNSQEWSLVKRHPSEKIFGVQMAGGYPDTMTRATQLIADRCEVDFIDINLGCPIDSINEKGAGCSLGNKSNRLMNVLRCMNAAAEDVPVTMKMRYGIKEGERNTHYPMAKAAKIGGTQLITLHPRSKEQRYTKAAEWDYVSECATAIDGRCPLWVCGDVMNYEDYYERLNNYPIDGIMIGRGALIKPWIFTEIEERRHWDITASERLGIIKKFVNYGLENWGSDHMGVEITRRFLLEWLSFQCRYIPVGLLEVVPQKINQRPPPYRGRNEMETLLASPASSDWVKISEMFLGKTPEGFLFVPKHNANAY